MSLILAAWAIVMAAISLSVGCGENAPLSPSVTSTPPAPAVSPAPTAPPLETLRLEPVLGGMEFKSPTNLAHTADGRVLVSEQAGRVLMFDEAALRDEHVFYSVFLDIRDRVNDSGSEEGLLGFAFDPGFADNGHFYVYYSASGPRRSVVSRFAMKNNNPEAADPDSELVLLEVEQPYPNHNGGQLAFGPEGYLYIGLGDGGSAGDPLNNGQDPATLLGSVLRIDVRNSTPEEPFRVPADNPFAGTEGARGEIWAYGLRNPWRFSFDRATGELWAGDVGQNRWEEIDLIAPGSNYGWNTLEGAHCFSPREGCKREGTVPPVWEYSLEGDACSVIGGYVYRGVAVPWLTGVYLYGDYCSGRVFGLRYDDGAATTHQQLAATGLRITSFGQDNDGELYLLSQRSGIYRMGN